MREASEDTMRILVTGGAGFIGSALVRHLVGERRHRVLNLDKYTYAASAEAVEAARRADGLYEERRIDICDAAAVAQAFAEFRPHAVMHLAAESHVDRSIEGPGAFIQTNVNGTFTMLQAALAYWSALPAAEAERFRFLHVSTDEVYGSLGATGSFTEDSPLRPNSPYAASKASSDLLVRAWHQTYGLPTLISNCSNNYGPYQFPEKLIPLIVSRALSGQSLPVYGKGSNVRDWLYVEDHVDALWTILTRGQTGQTYNVGGGDELTNLDLVTGICRILDVMSPRVDQDAHERAIRFVADRPGHDFRYAIDSGKIAAELGWRPRHTIAEALPMTVRWLVDNQEWIFAVRRDRYAGERLGLIKEGAGR